MKLRRYFDYRIILGWFMVLLATIFVIIGLQPAEAIQYEISAKLLIPSINLETDVTTLALKDHKLDTPDKIVGSYSRTENKTLLIGHSTTVFTDLEKVKTDDLVQYNNQKYRVTKIDILEKIEINMNQILQSADKDTIIIMTCAGQLLEGGDATHRLIVTAVEGE